MKGIHIFYCASQAATTTMDNSYHVHHQQPSSSTAAFNGGRAIDRHNPIIQDEKRLPIIPPPSSSATTTPHDRQNNKKKPKQPRKRVDEKRSKTIKVFADENNDDQLNKNNYVVRKQAAGVLLKWGCTRPGDFISPATSSRFLLSEKTFVSDDQFHDPLLKQVSPPPPPPPPAAAAEKTYKAGVNHDNNIALKNSALAAPPPPAEKTYKSVNHENASKNFAPVGPPPQAVEISYKPQNDKAALKKQDDGDLHSSPVKTQPPLSSSLPSDHQVVVLRVSLHCRGCERKMRKHISKMEGVTSFNIDFTAKKVTVVGDITPLAVLTSVSKVKNAKLLTPTTTISSSSQTQPSLTRTQY